MSGFSTLAAYKAAPRLYRATTATGPTSSGANSFTRMGGSTASGGASPGTAYNSDATASLTFQDISGKEKWLSEFIWHFIGNSVATSVWLIDKLVAVNFSNTTTGAKTLNSTALTRYTSGEDVMAWLEITTAGTTTIPAVTLSSYTDQDGNTGQAGSQLLAATATAAAGNWIGPFGLAAGDYGVKSVEQVNVDTAAGGSGAMNLVLARTLAVFGSTDSIVRAYKKNWLIPTVKIEDGATLTLLHRATNASEQATASITVALA